MDSGEDNDLGTRREAELRNDDRATAYAGTNKRSGYVLVLLLGVLVAVAFLAYGVFHRGELPSQGKPEATVGSTR